MHFIDSKNTNLICAGTSKKCNKEYEPDSKVIDLNTDKV